MRHNDAVVRHRVEDHVLNVVITTQANVDTNVDPSEWKLEALANKLVQYCVLLEGLTADDLMNNSKVRESCVCMLRCMKSKCCE